MVYVRLAKDWTDGGGTAYSAGEMVDVDAGTLAELEAAGIVVGPDWPGPTTSPTSTNPDWPGPTGDPGPTWPGPTSSGS